MFKVDFSTFTDYGDGKAAYVKTVGENKIPMLIYANNYDEIEDFEPQVCLADVIGFGSNIKVYENEDALPNEGVRMAPLAVIPAGLFAPGPDVKDFKPSPNIIFSGKVRRVETNPEAAEGAPDYCLTIEALEMEFDLYLSYDGIIKNGYFIQGNAFLLGNFYPDTSDDK